MFKVKHVCLGIGVVLTLIFKFNPSSIWSHLSWYGNIISEFPELRQFFKITTVITAAYLVVLLSAFNCTLVRCLI